MIDVLRETSKVTFDEMYAELYENMRIVSSTSYVVRNPTWDAVAVNQIMFVLEEALDET